MTTFQYLIETFYHLTGIFSPFTETLIANINSAWGSGLGQNPTVTEVCWLTLFIFLTWKIRFDLLALLMALIQILTKPKSFLNLAERTLDQQVLVFLSLAIIPQIFIHALTWGQSLLPEAIFSLPSLFIQTLIVAGLFSFGLRMNKRHKSINHVQILDGFAFLPLLSLSLLPGIPAIVMIWITLQLLNFNEEAQKKYFFLIFWALTLISLTLDSTFQKAVSLPESMGVLNFFTVITIACVSVHLALEWLEKSLGENLYRTYRTLLFLGSTFILVTLIVKR